MVSWDELDLFMQNIGYPQFTKDSFIKLYKSNDDLKNLLKFDPNGVKVYTDASDKLSSNNQGDDNTVSKMAQRATDLS